MTDRGHLIKKQVGQAIVCNMILLEFTHYMKHPSPKFLFSWWAPLTAQQEFWQWAPHVMSKLYETRMKTLLFLKDLWNVELEFYWVLSFLFISGECEGCIFLNVNCWITSLLSSLRGKCGLTEGVTGRQSSLKDIQTSQITRSETETSDDGCHVCGSCVSYEAFNWLVYARFRVFSLCLPEKNSWLHL